jgi:hypothetical protein
MRRLLALIVAVTAIVVGLPSSPVTAANPTTYFVDGGYGYARGGVAWSNRSVTVQGHIVDENSAVGAYTQVRFVFYLTNGIRPYATQTRTAQYGQDVSYNFVQKGPAGGIWSVNVHVCTSAPAYGCDAQDALLIRG